jgi:hypothetical protein
MFNTKLLFETEAKRDQSIVLKAFKILSDPNFLGIPAEDILLNDDYQYDKNEMSEELIKLIPERILICSLEKIHGFTLKTGDIIIYSCDSFNLVKLIITILACICGQITINFKQIRL